MEGVTCTSASFSCFKPQGAVASSLCRPKAVTCIVLKISVIGSNVNLLFWTNRQNIRTLGQFSSTVKEIYSTVLDANTFRREQLWESLKVKLQSSQVDQAAWRWQAPSSLWKKVPTFSSRGRKQKQLDEAVKLIGRNVTGVQGDAANLDDLDRLFDTVKREKGKIDILFASAGRGEALPLGEITEQHFRCGLRPEYARNAVYGSEGIAAVQRWRIDHHDRIRCFGEGFSRFRRVCGE